jgi:short-subunit dehydrogenase
MQISGARVLLTGASGGIGQALARALHVRGATLVLSGRGGEQLDALARELSAQAVPIDLATLGAPERLAAEAGAVDILLANAGLPGTGLLESFSIEELDRTLLVNLRAPVILARQLLPGMRERGRGQLVFVSSLAGKAATAHSAPYNATKFGLRGFALALRAELRGSGVGVSVLTPGFIRDAGMFAKSGAKLPPGIGTRSPEDVAQAAVRAIERDLGEVDVAPLALRLASSFAGLAPETAARITRLSGGERLARSLAEGQRSIR